MNKNQEVTMKKNLLIPAFFIFILFIIGCASFYANRYPGHYYAPTIAENIPIYNNFPPQPYEVIGEVGGSGAPASSWTGMGKRLREEAAKMGGDALVMAGQDRPYVGTYHSPGYSQTTGSAYGTADSYGGYTDVRVYGQSQTTYYPGTSTAMYGKRIRAVVIKFKSNIKIDKDYIEELIDKHPDMFGKDADGKGYWFKPPFRNDKHYFSTEEELNKLIDKKW